jgi:hypothetical protein
MPPLIVTVLGFPLLLALLVGIHVLVRRAARQGLGVGNAPTPAWRRVVAGAAGPIASYLVCALFFLAAIVGLGWPRQTLDIKVSPSGPAYEAGLRDGDRVVAIDGARPDSWDAFRAMIQSSGGSPIDVQVERGAQDLHFEVQPRDGRIDVASVVERDPVPPALAAATALGSPVFTWVHWAIELTKPKPMMGPVAVRPSDPSPWPLLFRLGELASYAWPLSVLIALVLNRRSARAIPIPVPEQD